MQEKQPGVGQSLKGKENQGSDSTAYQIYQNGLRDLKKRLTRAGQTLIDAMTASGRAVRADANNQEEHSRYAKAKKNKKHGVRKPEYKSAAHYRPIFTLPGIPNSAIMEHLYRMGHVKYEKFNELQVQYWDVNPNIFHATPQLTLQEIAGIKQDNEDSSKAGKLLSDLAHKKSKKKSGG